MDLEMIKTILVEIIREAQNLPSNELERINGTDVAVKRGREEEFKAYARLYVEVANNIKINDSVDYITIAFNDLQKEIKEEENNFYIEKAEGYYNSNYGNVEKFNQSNTVLSTLTKNHNSLQERFSVLQKNMRNATVTQTQLKQFDSISSDIRDFLNGMRHVKDTIIDLKRQINDNFTAAATTQLETLRNNYQNTANSVPAAYSSDGKSILKSDKLEYEVIEEGSSGFLGIGAKPAVIKARVKSSVEDTAKDFLKDVFEAMDMTVVVDVKYDEAENYMEIDLSGDEMGVLIGKRGQTLDSLQYLVSLVVNKNVENYIRVKVDTENYRQRRKETLENLAKNISYKVKRTKRPVSL